MQETKKKNGGASGNEDSKKKERHIVTWTQQEDDILREQISLNGTQNWAIIASKFKDKTSRQCRRRWYTYLNSDFKKGGWSPEEDMLLCEAQKIFGNRWTEIAKVVSGRRSHIPDLTESCNYGDRAHRVSGTVINHHLRPPFSVLGQNFHNANNLVVQPQVKKVKEDSDDAQNYGTEGTFLKKDDPSINALMQQAELLSSLALKVNTDNTEQSLENAWKVLQDFLNQSKENDTFRYTISDIDFQIEDFKDLLEDLRSSN